MIKLCIIDKHWGICPIFFHWFNPFTPESDQCQNSPAASQEIWHHTVWRTWLFIAYSDEKWLYYKFSLHHSYNCFFKGWENTLFELRSERGVDQKVIKLTSEFRFHKNLKSLVAVFCVITISTGYLLQTKINQLSCLPFLWIAFTNYSISHCYFAGWILSWICRNLVEHFGIKKQWENKVGDFQFPIAPFLLKNAEFGYTRYEKPRATQQKNSGVGGGGVGRENFRPVCQVFSSCF